MNFDKDYNREEKINLAKKKVINNLNLFSFSLILL